MNTITSVTVLWPSRRHVGINQIKRWASDDLANEEGREVRWDSLTDLQALAVVSYYGGVTLARIDGVTIPEYHRGDALDTTAPGRFSGCDGARQ